MSSYRLVMTPTTKRACYNPATGRAVYMEVNDDSDDPTPDDPVAPEIPPEEPEDPVAPPPPDDPEPEPEPEPEPTEHVLETSQRMTGGIQFVCETIFDEATFTKADVYPSLLDERHDVAWVASGDTLASARWDVVAARPKFRYTQGAIFVPVMPGYGF